MTKTFEFFWGDLTPDCQERLLEFLGGDNGNYDVFPFATLEVEEEEDDEEDDEEDKEAFEAFAEALAPMVARVNHPTDKSGGL